MYMYIFIKGLIVHCIGQYVCYCVFCSSILALIVELCIDEVVWFAASMHLRNYSNMLIAKLACY